MFTEGLQHHVDDARLLAWYAARHGKLPPNSEVFSLIAALEAKISTPDANNVIEPKIIAQLQKEIDALAKAVGPVTLRYLLQRGTLIESVRHVIESVTPFLLGLLTLLLTLYLAFQSSQLNQADTAIREYQDWVSQDPQEKLYSAWKMYRYESVLNIQKPPLAQLDAYQKLVEEARESFNKGQAIRTLLLDSSHTLYFPRSFEVLGFVQRLNQENEGSADTANLPASTYKPPGCKEEPVQPMEANIARTNQQQVPAAVDTYTNSFDCFLNHMNIDAEELNYPVWSVIYQTKAKINLMMTWLLPGLYGLLGTCVFVLRTFLVSNNSERLIHPKRVSSILLLVLRITLGGLAGIIIGWFWVPTAAGANENVVAAPISSIPFGLAFMAGYSIETLFSLLDRANRAIDSGENTESRGTKDT